MNDWHYSNSDEVQHRSGFSIQLVSGSWAEPNDLNPRAPRDMGAAQYVRLLREGLLFAATANSPQSDARFADALKIKKKKTGKTLSLRNKEPVKG